MATIVIASYASLTTSASLAAATSGTEKVMKVLGAASRIAAARSGFRIVMLETLRNKDACSCHTVDGRSVSKVYGIMRPPGQLM